nr:hypothetical protein [uncultured Rhodococcus sp.]
MRLRPAPGIERRRDRDPAGTVVQRHHLIGIASVAAPRPVRLTAHETPALIAGLAALGPSETDSAASAMNALVEALTTD